MLKRLEYLLNSRICDVEEGATNTETFREYIRRVEEEFSIVRPVISSVEDLEEYLDYLSSIHNRGKKL